MCKRRGTRFGGTVVAVTFLVLVALMATAGPGRMPALQAAEVEPAPPEGQTYTGAKD